MKKLILVAMVFGLVGVLSAGDQCCSSKEAKAGMEKAQAAACEVEEGQACTAVKVETAKCGMCADAIETAAKKVDGVTVANVDLEKGVAHVHYADASVDVKDVEMAIAAAGYDANDTKRDKKAYADLPKCCK